MTISKPKTFRPILILPIFSKIIDKGVHVKVSRFQEENKLLTDFGYRTNQSIKLALNLLFDEIQNHIDNRKLDDAVYIDLTKELNIVGQCALISKLLTYGINGSWMDQQLLNQEQSVSIHNYYSTEQVLIRTSS